MARRKKTVAASEPEVIAPRKACEIRVRIDATYLRTLAVCARAVARETLLPDVLETLVYAARGGQMEAFIALPGVERALDPLSVAEAVCEGLIVLGVAARPAQKEVSVSYGYGGSKIERGIECSWRVAL